MSTSRPAIRPRADVLLMEGYHSPQLDVDVRLNTNEAPEAPPAAFIADLAAAVSGIDLNRYPDREAIALRQALADFHGVSLEQVYCANGSNEVLQSLLLAYGGPGRVAVVFEPTYALHSHIAHVTGTKVIEGERDEQYLISASEVERVFALARAEGEDNPAVTFLDVRRTIQPGASSREGSSKRYSARLRASSLLMRPMANSPNSQRSSCSSHTQALSSYEPFQRPGHFAGACASATRFVILRSSRRCSR